MIRAVVAFLGLVVMPSLTGSAEAQSRFSLKTDKYSHFRELLIPYRNPNAFPWPSPVQGPLYQIVFGKPVALAKLGAVFKERCVDLTRGGNGAFAQGANGHPSPALPIPTKKTGDGIAKIFLDESGAVFGLISSTDKKASYQRCAVVGLGSTGYTPLEAMGATLDSVGLRDFDWLAGTAAFASVPVAGAPRETVNIYVSSSIDKFEPVTTMTITYIRSHGQ